jgi:hypothetical protein
VCQSKGREVLQRGSRPRCPLPKSVFQVHAVDKAGKVEIRRKLRRSELISFFKKQEACTVVFGLRRGAPLGPTIPGIGECQSSLSRPMSSLGLITSCRHHFALRLMIQHGALFELGATRPHDGMRRVGRYNLRDGLAASQRLDQPTLRTHPTRRLRQRTGLDPDPAVARAERGEKGDEIGRLGRYFLLQDRQRLSRRRDIPPRCGRACPILMGSDSAATARRCACR